MQVLVSKISIDLLTIENIASQIKATLNSFSFMFWGLLIELSPTHFPLFLLFHKKMVIYSNIKKSVFHPIPIIALKHFFIHVLVVHVFLYSAKFNMHFLLTEIKINKFITNER